VLQEGIANAARDGGMSLNTQRYNHAIFFGDEMKTVANVISILLILAGGTFLLQGINVLPGSYMTGDPQWAINGSVMIAIALGLLVWANRRKRNHD
jgi:hypothetical protein